MVLGLGARVEPVFWVLGGCWGAVTQGVGLQGFGGSV